MATTGVTVRFSGTLLRVDMERGPRLRQGGADARAGAAIDLIAEGLALDPVQVRMRNFVPPDAFPHWSMAKHLDSGDPGALTKPVHLSGYDRRRERQREARAEGRLHGVGVAFELSPEGADFAGSYARGFDTSTVR